MYIVTPSQPEMLINTISERRTTKNQNMNTKTGYIAKQTDNGKYIVGRNCEKFQHIHARQYDTIEQAEKAAIKRGLEITQRHGF